MIIILFVVLHLCRALGGSSGSESGTDDDTGTVSKYDQKHKNPAELTGMLEFCQLFFENRNITSLFDIILCSVQERKL